MITLGRRKSIVRRMHDPDTIPEAVLKLLATGHPAFRAAGILLLKEYAADLSANGRGEYASRLVDWMRANDPCKAIRTKDSDRIVP